MSEDDESVFAALRAQDWAGAAGRLDGMRDGPLHNLARAMLYTMPEETDKRERLWQAVHIVGKVRDNLKLILNGGRLAQAEIDNVAFLQTRK